MNSTRSIVSRIRPLLPSSLNSICQHINVPQRLIHESRKKLPTPSPSSQVPDVHTFLTIIGRNLVEHESKFESWDDFMSSDLRAKGIEPPRDRRYLLGWRHKYRCGVPLEEFKRGVVKDGGERRRKMVLAKKAVDEAKARRKAEAGAKILGTG